MLIAEKSPEDVAAFGSKSNVQFRDFQGHSHARLQRAHILLNTVPSCHNYTVEPVSFSDHSLVIFTLGNKAKVPKWNWALWKLNASLIKDTEFV